MSDQTSTIDVDIDDDVKTGEVDNENEIEIEEEEEEDEAETGEKTTDVDTLRSCVELQKSKDRVLNAILDRSNRAHIAREAERERKRLSLENKRLAKQTALKEEHAFKMNAYDFYQLLRSPMYVNRDVEHGNSDCSFTISDKPSMKIGEIMTFWENERLILRPWHHQEYMLSMPAMYIVKREVELKMNRRGGTLKPASVLSIGGKKTADERELGPIEIRTALGGKILKSQFRLPSKKALSEVIDIQKHIIKQDEGPRVTRSPNNDKKIRQIAKTKLKVSGRDPSRSKFSGRRRLRAGANP
jgi:hypothetical protein